MSDMKVRNVYVGRTKDGSRIFVDVRLTDAGVFTASGLGVEYRKQEATFAGQMLEELLNIDRPATGLTRDDLLELHRLWKLWHLNHMRGDGSKWETVGIPPEDVHSIRVMITKLSKLTQHYMGR